MNTSWGMLPTRPQDLCESNADDSVRIVSLKNTDMLQLKPVTIFCPYWYIAIKLPRFILWMLMCSGDIDLLIRNSYTVYGRALVFTPRSLYYARGNSCQQPSNRKLGGHQCWSRRLRPPKKIYCFMRNGKYDILIGQPVVWSLYWQSYRGLPSICYIV